MDRIQTQEQIHKLVEEAFSTKKQITLEDFIKINEDFTSEMFLALMCVIEASLPCTTNFYRFKKNYEDQQK